MSTLIAYENFSSLFGYICYIYVYFLYTLYTYVFLEDQSLDDVSGSLGCLPMEIDAMKGINECILDMISCVILQAVIKLHEPVRQRNEGLLNQNYKRRQLWWNNTH